MLTYPLSCADRPNVCTCDTVGLDGNTAKQRALRIHHERRQGGAVPSPVVAFLTMVEHYAGLDVSPLRIHLPPPSTSHAADPPVNRNAPSTGRGPPHGEISVHDL